MYMYFYVIKFENGNARECSQTSSRKGTIVSSSKAIGMRGGQSLCDNQLASSAETRQSVSRARGLLAEIIRLFVAPYLDHDDARTSQQPFLAAILGRESLLVTAARGTVLGRAPLHTYRRIPRSPRSHSLSCRTGGLVRALLVARIDASEILELT